MLTSAVHLSCTADGLLVLLRQNKTVMADISKTEKVQLDVPDLDELRGGKCTGRTAKYC